MLGWFPSVYDTTRVVRDRDSFLFRVRQMILLAMVLALFKASQISRFMRASMLDNLQKDYVRMARAKGLREWLVLLIHVLRNSMIPVVTVIALGQLLIVGIQRADIPLVQMLMVIFAILIVVFNLVADVPYGLLAPRIGYDRDHPSGGR